MATHDYVIDNSTGASVRADINNALKAILTNNGGNTDPATVISGDAGSKAFSFWADTNSSPAVMKIRNAADNAWIELFQLDGTFTLEDGSASTPALAFRDDLNTGIFSSAADRFNVTTAGIERMELGTAGSIFNEDGADVDFRIEGDTDPNLFFVDASTDRVGIGLSSPTVKLDVAGSLRLQSGGATRTLHIGPSSAGIEYNVDGTTFIQGRTDAFPLAFKTQSAERMRIDSSGKVGIGTTSPSNMLHLSGTDPIIQFTDTAGGDSFGIFASSSNFLGFFNFTDSRNDMVIDGSGKVGIGTTSPVGKLTVNSGNITLSDGFGFTNGADADKTFMAGTSGASGNLTFGVNNTERMRIDSSGNVGIGTSSPSSFNSFARNLVVATSSNTGLSLSGNDSSSNFAGLHFCGGSTVRGFIEQQLGSTGTMTINNIANGMIKFSTNNLERMRINDSGRVLISESVIADFDAFLTVHVGGSTAAIATHSGTTATRHALACCNDNGHVGGITTSGSATSFNTSSDYRLKENATAISGGYFWR